MTGLLSGVAAGLWSGVIVQDLKRREVSLWVLVGLALVALVGHPWPWWVLMGLVLLWPIRWRANIVWLTPVVFVAGLLTNQPVPAMAFLIGTLAWSRHWWGGADSIVLIAIGLRTGLEPFVATGFIVALAGVGLQLARKRSLLVIPAAAAGLLPSAAGGEIPEESEMPAAALFGACALVMEVFKLCQTVFG
jgi:hypothetical protein